MCKTLVNFKFSRFSENKNQANAFFRKYVESIRIYFIPTVFVIQNKDKPFLSQQQIFSLFGESPPLLSNRHLYFSIKITNFAAL